MTRHHRRTQCATPAKGMSTGATMKVGAASSRRTIVVDNIVEHVRTDPCVVRCHGDFLEITPLLIQNEQAAGRSEQPYSTVADFGSRRTGKYLFPAHTHSWS